MKDKNREQIREDIGRIFYHQTEKFWNDLINALIEYVDDNYERRKTINIPD